ncbi:RHS repeat-associated core domain-containing protein [Desulfatibacillum aliphaticivorans]|uniref:RHS repeat-associated core domain-containing protein n=1 Tax=Desulfatibacillum aliphaticivorans TaxID=218208 RepID=UPI0003FFFF16|nr:RHS repeat-associated core domain-containing protein [Desulfatibacillum aliphaticivorans]
MATKYIFGADRRIAKITDGEGIQYFSKDHLGSSTVVTDDSGAVVEQADYRPFGEDRFYTGSVATPTPYKYTDQELDASTGLYNYDARHYDPAIGRFISPDSLIPNVYDPQQLNPYAYCRNNPLIYIDPTGHWAGAVAGAAIGAVSGAVAGFSSNTSPMGSIVGAVTGALVGGVVGGIFGSVGLLGASDKVATTLGAAAGALAGGMANRAASTYHDARVEEGLSKEKALAKARNQACNPVSEIVDTTLGVTNAKVAQTAVKAVVSRVGKEKGLENLTGLTVTFTLESLEGLLQNLIGGYRNNKKKNNEQEYGPLSDDTSTGSNAPTGGSSLDTDQESNSHSDARSGEEDSMNSESFQNSEGSTDNQL